jgi:4-amino-4-deoxy-L-arabinose transferase-like glycosyltransferase
VTGGRRAGTIAGLLLATAGTHIVVNSHIAYVNSLTPLGTAVTLTLFYVACERAAGRWLIAAGVAFGLTLQTHPVAIALAPGMALWFLAARRQWAWFRRPTLYGAIGAAALAYSPVLAVLLTQSSRARTQIITRSYAFAIPHSPGEYFVNLQGLMVELARMLGAVFPNLDAPRQYLVQPLVCAYLALTVLALWAVLRLHKSYLVCIIGSVVLLVPLFNRQYGDFPYFTRYIALLLPPIYAAVGLGLDRLWTTLAARPTERWWRWVVTGLFLLGVSWLALEPLRLTAEFYAGQVRGRRTNTLLLDMTRQIAQAPERPIFLDDGLAAGEFPSGGNVLMSLQGWFDLAGIPWMPTSEGHRFACGQDAWLVATAEAASRFTLRVTNCRAERITGAVIPTRPGRAPLELGLYHLQAAP